MTTLELVVQLLLFNPKTAPKAISEGLKSKISLGGHVPHVPHPPSVRFARFMQSVTCTLEPPFSKFYIHPPLATVLMTSPLYALSNKLSELSQQMSYELITHT